MDIFLIILGSICLLVGLIGCIVPMLPGPPIAYVALVLLQLTDKVTFTPVQLFFWLFLVVIPQNSKNHAKKQSHRAQITA